MQKLHERPNSLEFGLQLLNSNSYSFLSSYWLAQFEVQAQGDVQAKI
jgi:hypothetical protein